MQEDEEWWECKQMPRQSSLFLGCQFHVFAAPGMLCKDEIFIGFTLKALHLKNTPDHLKGFCLESVRNTLTRVPPSDLSQFAHIKRILSLGCLDDWMCVQLSTKWLNLRGSYLPHPCVCVCMWMVPAVGRVVCQIWAHESDSRYSRGLIPAWSLAWLLWHKVPSLLHFILTLWSSFTLSDCYFTSSWSRELESTCPGRVTHERESINRYCFSSFFCNLARAPLPPGSFLGLSRVRTSLSVRLTSITIF